MPFKVGNKYGGQNAKEVFSTRIDKKRGYLYIKVPHQKGWMYLHRYLMEKHLGRKLKTNEIVHHKNGDRGDNRIENFEILLRHPTQPHICPKCGYKYYHNK